MKRRAFIAAALLGLLLQGARRSFAASIPVTLDLSNIQFQGLISLSASPLPGQAFFGKHVVIPLQVTSNIPIINPKPIQAQIFYELADSAGTAQGGWQSVPVQLQKDPKDAKKLTGTAVIERSNFQSVRQNGRLRYYFRAQKSGMNVFLSPSRPGVIAAPGENAPPDSFEVAFIDTLQFSVGANGGIFKIQDTYQVDGKTAAGFDSGALSGPGTLVIRQEDINTVPRLRGLKPATVFSFDLQGTSLVRTARITLSYAANIDGSVVGPDNERLHFRDLAMYGLKSFSDPNGWQLLSRPDTDPTLHTVTAVAPHLSLFALFPTGPVSSADLRARERILTPNGDGVNDTALFTGLATAEEVQLFDIRGRRVRTILGPPHIWDGRDDEGKIVESGVYLYQYASQGERTSGVIVIAK